MRPVLELSLVMLGCLAIGVMSALLVQAVSASRKKPGAPEVKCWRSGPELRRGVAMWNSLGRLQSKEPRA